MAAVTTDKGPYILALGPIKVEVATLSSVDDGDTYVTRLVRPEFALYLGTGDNNANAFETQCSISSKTITFNNSSLNGTNSATGVLIVFGF